MASRLVFRQSEFGRSGVWAGAYLRPPFVEDLVALVFLGAGAILAGRAYEYSPGDTQIFDGKAIKSQGKSIAYLL